MMVFVFRAFYVFGAMRRLVICTRYETERKEVTDTVGNRTL